MLKKNRMVTFYKVHLELLSLFKFFLSLINFPLCLFFFLFFLLSASFPDLFSSSVVLNFVLLLGFNVP